MTVVIAALVVAGLATIGTPGQVQADHEPSGYTLQECSDRYQSGTFNEEEFNACRDNAQENPGGVGDTGDGNIQGDCGEGYIQLSIAVELDDGTVSNCLPKNGTGANNPIFIYMRAIIRFLTAGVGLAVIITIVVSGIQYMTSRGNPQSIQKAQQRLGNAIIALLMFVFSAAILNFLIPGGLL